MPGQSIVTVRFYVGQPLEPSYVKLIRKLNENADRMTPGATGWVVKPIDVDDVPIVTFTLTSGSRDDYALRRMADEVVARLQGVDNAGVAYVVGGRPRELLIRPSATRMASYRDCGAGSEPRHPGLERQRPRRRPSIGTTRTCACRPASSSRDARDLEDLVVGAWSGRPVYLRDVAEVERRRRGIPRLRALPPRAGVGPPQGGGRRGKPDWRTGRRAAVAVGRAAGRDHRRRQEARDQQRLGRPRISWRGWPT